MPIPLESSEPLADYTASGTLDLTSEPTNIHQTRADKIGEFLKYGPPAVIAGAADTILQSVGLLDDKDMENYYRTLTQKGGDYYAQNKEAAQAVGDLATMFIPGLGAMKLHRAAGVAYNAYTAGKDVGIAGNALKHIFNSGKSMQQIMAPIRERDSFLAINRATDFVSDITRQNLVASARRTALLDSLKSSTAFEIGVLGTMNASPTLYPDEMSTVDTLMLNAGFSAVGAVAENMFLNRSIRASAQGVATLANKLRLYGEGQLTDTIFRPGFRDIGVVSEARAVNRARSILETADNDIMRTNVNNDIQLYESSQKQQIELMFKDSIFSDQKFTHSITPGANQVATVLDAQRRDPYTLLNTFSLENNNLTFAEHVDYATEIKAPILDKMQEAEQKLVDEIDKADAAFDFEKSAALTAKLDKQRAIYDVIDNSYLTILESNGDLVLASERRPIFQDGERKIKYLAGNENEPGVHFAQVASGITLTGKKDLVGFTDDGHMLLPQQAGVVQPTATPAASTAPQSAGTTTITQTASAPPFMLQKIVGGVDATLVVPHANLYDPQFFKQELKDFTADWGHHSGKWGKVTFAGLAKISPDLANAMRAWEGSRTSSPIQRWIENNTADGKRIYDAYEPMRAQLREKFAGPDGTIVLYRGQNVRETANPTNDVVSYTSNPRVAHDQFGSGSNHHVIARRVHIDDIILVFDGIGGEFEYIVKGHKRLRVGEHHWNAIQEIQVPIPAGATVPVQMQTINHVIQATNVPVAPGAPIVDNVVANSSVFNAQPLEVRSAAYDAGQRALETFKWGKTQVFLTSNDHHTHYDWTLELYARGQQLMAEGKLDRNVFNQTFNFGLFANSSNPLERLETTSLERKFKEALELFKTRDAAKAGTLQLPKSMIFTDEDIRKMLNLPGTSNGQRHPLFNIFEQLYLQGDTQLFGPQHIRTLDHLKQLMAADTAFPKLTPYQQADITASATTRGNMYNMPRNRTSVALLKRGEIAENLYSRDYLIAATAQNRANVMDLMANADKYDAPLIKDLHDYMQSTAVFQTAKQTDSLVEGVQRNRGAITQQAYSAGEAPAILAARTAEQLSDKRFRNVVSQYFKQFENTFVALKHPNNRADLENYAMALHARRQGWDLKPGSVVSPDGKGQFWELRDTKHNRDLFQRLYGMPFDEKAHKYMPAPTGQASAGQRQYMPMLITANAGAALNAIEELGLRVFNESNHLKRMAGRGEGRAKEHWVPPINFSRQDVVFLVEPATGNFHAVIGGRTLADAHRQADIAIAEAEKAGQALAKVDKNIMGRYFDLGDEAFEKMVNFSDPIAQTGKSKGTSVSNVVQTGTQVVDDSIASLQQGFESVLRRTRALYYEPQLNLVNHAYKASSAQEAGKKGQTIWQQYIAAMFGNPTLSPNDRIGAAYFAGERIYDDTLNQLWDKYRQYLGPEAGKPTRQQEKAFAAISDKMATHNPFTSAADYAERTFNVALPPSMKKHMASINSITTLLSLRLFDAGHALLTLTSLPAIMPAVIRGLAKTDMEKALGAIGDEQHAARIGAFGYKVTPDHAMFSPARALVSAIHDAFSQTDEFKNIWREASGMGFMDQAVAESWRNITAPHQGYIEKMINERFKWTTALSDKSETLARGITFMVGYNIAKRTGINNKTDAFAFAHRFANETIGDYSAANRPRMFQGAIGMPLGLFQTFMLNYYQRIFGYIENRQVRALVTQYATQASVFGGSTVPGFQPFTEFFASNYDGTVNPVDGMERRFGSDFTEVVMYGALSNLPKIFGADGISLYTRGDVNVRSPATLFSPENTPQWNAATSLFQGMRKTIQMFQTQGGFSGQQFGEILQNYAVSRAVKNVALLATGEAVDRRGQLVNDDVYNGLSIATRLVGMRPMRESVAAEKMYQIRSTEMAHRDKMLALRDGVRASFRSDTGFDADTFAGFAHKYVKAGGSAEGFASFLANQALASRVDKVSREFMDAVKDDGRMHDVLKLISILPERGDPPEPAG